LSGFFEAVELEAQKSFHDVTEKALATIGIDGFVFANCDRYYKGGKFDHRTFSGYGKV
jgi:hypothetical protein